MITLKKSLNELELKLYTLALLHDVKFYSGSREFKIKPFLGNIGDKVCEFRIFMESNTAKVEVYGYAKLGQHVAEVLEKEGFDVELIFKSNKPI